MPITWKNVNAPGFVAPAGLARSGGAAVVGAFDQFANAANAADQNRITAYDNATEQNTGAANISALGLNNLDTFQEDSQRLSDSLAGTNVDMNSVANTLSNRQEQLSGLATDVLARENYNLDNEQKKYDASNRDEDRASKLAEEGIRLDTLQAELDNLPAKNAADLAVKNAQQQELNLRIAAHKSAAAKIVTGEEHQVRMNDVVNQLTAKSKEASPTADVSIDPAEFRSLIGTDVPVGTVNAFMDGLRGVFDTKGQAAKDTAAALKFDASTKFNKPLAEAAVQGLQSNTLSTTTDADVQEEVLSWLATKSGGGIPFNTLLDYAVTSVQNTGGLTQANQWINTTPTGTLENGFTVQSRIGAKDPEEEVESKKESVTDGYHLNEADALAAQKQKKPTKDVLINQAIEKTAAPTVPAVPAVVDTPPATTAPQTNNTNDEVDYYFDRLNREATGQRKVGKLYVNTLNDAKKLFSSSAAQEAKGILASTHTSLTEKQNALNILKESLVAAPERKKSSIQRDITKFEKQLNKAR